MVDSLRCGDFGSQKMGRGLRGFPTETASQKGCVEIPTMDNSSFPSSVHRMKIPFRSRAISVYETGRDDDDRRPVVLLHGSAGAAVKSFWALQPMIARKHRVVSFDFLDPIAGDSDDFYVEQVCSVLETVGHGQPVDLVGYSFGAVVAATTAAKYPEQVRSLVLVAGWARTDAVQNMRNDIWSSLHEDDSAEKGRFTILMNYSYEYINSKTNEEIERLVSNANDNDDRHTKLSFNRSVDIMSDMESIVSPTLVVGCKSDNICPIHHSYMLFGAIEGARLFEIHSGHGVVNERPAELAAAISGFVNDPLRHPAGTRIENMIV